MKKIISQTKYFQYPTLLLFLLGLIALGFLNTGDFILSVSESRSHFWNVFFSWGTQLGEEPVYFILFILFLLIKFRFAIFIPIIGIIATLISYGLKSFFQHPRPKVYFEEAIAAANINIIEGVHMIGGLTSFPSGHTISGFCLFGFTAFVLSQRKNGVALQILCLIVALIVGFSRIYLFQHFLKDVVSGMLLGSLLSIFLAWLCDTYFNDSEKWHHQSILSYFRDNKAQRA